MTSASFDISLGLEKTHVLVTGGCGLIGRIVVDAFRAAGAHVCVFDLPDAVSASPFSKHTNDVDLHTYPADISDMSSLHHAFDRAEQNFGPIECCVALASIDLSSLPQTDSLCDADPGVWQNVFAVNVHGTFLTCRRWLRGIRDAVAAGRRDLRNVSCVLMGSESGTFGVRTQAAYAAGKAAVQYGLLRSLAQDAPRICASARVNAVAPGAVDTPRFAEECARYGEKWRWEECEATVPLARPVPAEDVARTVLVLASERFGGSTHGQVVHVDGGKTGSVVWDQGEAGARKRGIQEKIVV